MVSFEEHTLGELTINHDAGRRPVRSSERAAGTTPYYGASGIVDWVNGHTHEGEYLLVSEDGENLRSRSTPIAFGAKGRIWVNNHAHVLSGREKHDTRFLQYALALIDVSGYLTGSAQPKLSKAAMQSIRLRLPTASHRRAIAEVLGALDDKISANDRIARTSLELARALYQHELNAKVWEHVTLADLCAKGSLQLGDGYRTKRSEHGQPGLRILRAGDVDADSITPSGADFVSDEFRGAIGSKASQPGDVVMTTKGTVGRVAVVPPGIEQVVYSPQLCYFRVLEPDSLVPGFLSGWFRSNALRRQAEARMFKSDMAPYINLRDIHSMAMTLVPLADQQRIGETQSALEHVAHTALHENNILASTHDELLPLLMSGKVCVRDAEWLVGEVP